jgi:hypothetical protein
MTLTKEKAELIDAFLIELRNHKEPSLFIKSFQDKYPDRPNIETLPKLLQMAATYQLKHNLAILRINGHYADQLKDLDWFVDSNGFTAIWEQEEKERQFQSDVKTVNDSVKTTNKAIKDYLPYQLGATIASVLVAIAACLITYKTSTDNDETKTRLKTLEQQQSKIEQLIQQNRTSLQADTVHSIIVIDTIK